MRDQSQFLLAEKNQHYELFEAKFLLNNEYIVYRDTFISLVNFFTDLILCDLALLVKERLLVVGTGDLSREFLRLFLLIVHEMLSNSHLVQCFYLLCGYEYIKIPRRREINSLDDRFTF